MKVALDFHGVCADLMSAVMMHANRERGLNFAKRHVLAWNHHRHLGMTDAEFWRYIDRAVHEDPTNAGLLAESGAIGGIRRLVAEHDVEIVSATDDGGDGIRGWLNRHNLRGIPVRTVDKHTGDKFRLPYTAFVDDNPNMAGKAPRGKHLVLFDQPWNRADIILGPRDYRAKGWGRVLEVLAHLEERG